MGSECKSSERVRADWQRDLRPLLPQLVAYEDARDGVENLFGRVTWDD